MVGCCIYIDIREKTANKAVYKASNDMEADTYTKPDEDTGKKMIYEMVRQRKSTARMLREEYLSRQKFQVSDTPRGGAKGLGRTLQWVTIPPRKYERYGVAELCTWEGERNWNYGYGSD